MNKLNEPQLANTDINAYPSRKSSELLSLTEHIEKTSFLALQELMNMINDYIFILNMEGDIIALNQSVLSSLGYDRNELIGRHVSEIHPPEHREDVNIVVGEMLAGKREFCPIPLLAKDSRRVPVETKVSVVQIKGQEVLVGISRDITEQRNTEENLLAQREFLVKLTACSTLTEALDLTLDEMIKISKTDSGGIYLLDPDTKELNLETSRGLSKSFIDRVSSPKALSERWKLVMEKRPIYSDYNFIASNINHLVMDEGLKSIAIIPVIHGESVIACINIASHTLDTIHMECRVVLESMASLAGTIIDHLKAEKKIRLSEKRYKGIVEDQTELVCRFRSDGTLTFVNEAYCRYFKKEKHELIGIRFFPLIPESDQQIVEQTLKEITPEKPSISYQHRLWNGGGELRWVAWTDRAIYDQENELIEYQSVGRDVTDRKELEHALKKAKRKTEDKYKNIFKNAPIGILSIDIKRKVITANISAAKIAGYNSVEEGLREVNIDNIGELYVNKSHRKKILDTIQIKGKILGKSISFYDRHGSVKWAKVSAVGIFDERENLIGTEAIIEDISLLRQAKKQLNRTVKNLRSSLDGTIETLALAIEQRDPYTAGHQRRVMQLSLAIGKVMGISSYELEGIKMAAMIHDIGKISVPNDILSKPSSLSKIELELLRQHSLKGYSIVKNVKFPWPIADIIYQHHERIDGSGYPQGLKGDKILREARIIGVADTVEAMTSHRPYRPALGKDIAIEEIVSKKGVLYDEEIVNACLMVLNEGFTFDQQVGREVT